MKAVEQMSDRAEKAAKELPRFLTDFADNSGMPRATVLHIAEMTLYAASIHENTDQCLAAVKAGYEREIDKLCQPLEKIG